MTDGNRPEGTTSKGAVELSESALDQASGGSQGTKAQENKLAPTADPKLPTGDGKKKEVWSPS